MRMTTRHPIRYLLTALALVPMSLSAYLFEENPLDEARLSWDYDGQQPTAPVIICPADVTIECDESTGLSNTGNTTATANCDLLADISFSDSVAAGTCPQEQVITRTWTATDNCENSTSCEQTVTVIYTTSPVITCPDDVTTECKAEVSGGGPDCILDVLGEALNVDPSQTGLATTPDNCDPAPVITLSDSVVTDTCPQETVITRTWTATNDCGNSTSCEQTVTVVNMTSPVIICPDDVTIDCDASTATAVAGYASATDTCDPNPTVVFADSFADGTYAQENTITRTWTATDACSNSTSCDQAITITDTNPPIITFCPPDLIGEWPAGGALKAAFPFEVTLSTKTATHPYFGTGNSRGYVINGGQGDELTLVRGVTYAFNINGTFGHPFFIGTSAIGGSANTNSTVTDGLAGDGNFIVSGTLLFTPNAGHPDLLWYQCGIHSFMGWRLNLVDDSATATDNCDPSPSVTLTDSVAAGTCPIVQTITRKWTAQDSCGNTSTCIQTITLQDLTPPNIACPGNATIECNASTAPGNTGQAAAIDSCDPNPVVSFSDSSASSSCPQASSITRIWTATDACENSTQCDQTITVSDTVSPAISCPDDVAIECSASSAAGNTGQATAIDACDPNPVITFSDSVNGSSCSYELIITRTWIAVDACGNGSSCRQTVSVADATAPVLTCPADVVIACTDSTVTDTIGQATATDSCDPGPTVSFSDAVTSGSCPHDSKITRAWTATDTCGNVSLCSQTIDVADDAAPILACPNNITIACNESTAPDDTGQAMASDACDPSSAVAFSDSTAAGACPAEFTVSRKWTADDACGSGAQCVQTITVADSAAPALTCPADITINCNESTHETVTGSAVAIDTCSTGLTLLFADNVAAGSCGLQLAINRTWTATDACGNASSCTQILARVDTTPPSITCAPNIFYQCHAVPRAAVHCFAVTGIATLDIDGQVYQSLAFASEVKPTAIVRPPPPYETGTDLQTELRQLEMTAAAPAGSIIIRERAGRQSFGRIDDVVINNGNLVGGTAYFDVHLEVEIPGVGIWENGDVPVRFGLTPITTLPMTGTLFDITPLVVTLFDQGTSNQAGSITELSFITQTLVICDQEASVLSNAPQVGDNCDPAPIVEYVDVVNEENCPQESIVLRTWTAMDACGNSASCTQTINIIDSIPPEIDCPPSIVINCDVPEVAGNTSEATAIDNCDPAPVISFTESLVGGSCASERTLLRTWHARDACLNGSDCLQTITVTDLTPPNISCPADIIVGCNESTAPQNTGNAGATDNCDPAPLITFADSDSAGLCLRERIITRTWTATDACGNNTNCPQRITVTDTTAPVITCPPSLTVRCDASSAPAAAGNATATDNCDDNPEISLNDNVADGTCPQEFGIARSWSATDTCGNTADCEQIIFVTDAAAPAIICPPNITIACDAASNPGADGQATATDNCDGSPVISFNDNVGADSCPQQDSVTRIWSAVDACGNSSECFQSVTVIDDTAPVVTCPTDAGIDCNASTAPAVAGYASATDTCDPNPTVVFADSFADGTCAQENTLTRTWTAADACGNSSTCLQTITIVDETPPVLSCPIDIFQDHDPGISGAVLNFAVAAPVDCGEVTVAVSQESGSLFPRGETTVTVTATDPCGNTAGCSFAVTIENAVPEPKNVTESVVFNNTENVIAVLDNDSDLDDDPLTVESVTAPNNGTVEIAAGEMAVIYTPDTDFIGTDKFMYTVTDRHGGRASATVTVHVRPETAFSLFLDGATPGELVFGHSSIATIGFDDALDIVAPEPNDSGATAYLLNEQIESLDHQQLLVEFLPTLIICRWRVVVNVPDGRQQVRLTWDVSAAAPERLIMLVPVDGESPTGTTLDMKQAESVTVDENSVFEIAYGMKTELTVTLDSPWNLISVPVMTTQTIADVFSVAPRDQPPGISAWYWEADGYIQFDNDTPLRPEVGYWVFCDIAMESQIISGILADGVIDLLPNWNLVGPVDTVPPPGTPAIDKGIWCWETEIQDYEKIGNDPLRVPRAYWMYATEPTTIDLGNGQ